MFRGRAVNRSNEFLALQDEDFEADESENSGSVGAEDDDEDEDNETSSMDNDMPPTVPATFGADLLQTLQGETPIENEPIFSDSDISREFAEEQEDLREILRQELVELEDDGTSGLERCSSENDQPTGIADHTLVSNTEQGQSVTAQASLAAVLSATAQRTGRSSPTKRTISARLADRKEFPTPGTTTPAVSQSVSPPGSLKQKQGDVEDVPIAARTRAQVSLIDVPIEVLEAGLDTENLAEPLLVFGVDDALEYERFLQALKGSSGRLIAGEIASRDGVAGEQPLPAETDIDGEDSDDEDFLVELERMFREGLADEEGMDLDLGLWMPSPLKGPHQGVGMGSITPGLLLDSNMEVGRGDDEKNARRSRGKRKKKIQPRRSARLMSRGGARPLYAARAMDRHADALFAAGMNSGSGAGQEAPLAAFTGLHGLAAVASAMAAPQIPHPLPSQPPSVIIEAARSVIWRPPLPKALRQQYELPASMAASETMHVFAAAFQPDQYSMLYSLIHRHVQLLTQTLAMAVAVGDPETAVTTTSLLQSMSAFTTSQGTARQMLGVPPYVSACLGIDTGEGRGVNASGSWTPQNPGSAFTVADVAVLRAVPRMLEHMPPAVPAPFPEAPPSDGLSLVLDEQGRLRKRPKRLRKKAPTTHQIWGALPDDVAEAVQHIRKFFDPGMEPKAPTFTATAQMLFTPAEDELLAWGIRKRGYEWAKIRAELLPTKTEKVLFHRKKNRTAGLAPDNVVKDAVSLITGPLTPAEETLLAHATEYYGKQAHKWEIICREQMPHRHPQVLSMLWSERTKEAAANGRPLGAPPAINTALLEGHATAPYGLATHKSGKQDGVELSFPAGMNPFSGGAGDAIGLTQEALQASLAWIQMMMPANSSEVPLMPLMLPGTQFVGSALGINIGMPPMVVSNQFVAHQVPVHLNGTPAGVKSNNGTPLNHVQPSKATPGVLSPSNQNNNHMGDGSQSKRARMDTHGGASMIMSNDGGSQQYFNTERMGDQVQCARMSTDIAWLAEDDRTLLRLALAAGGTLTEPVLSELTASMGRERSLLEQRGTVLVERFMERARKRAVAEEGMDTE